MQMKVFVSGLLNTSVAVICSLFSSWSSSRTHYPRTALSGKISSYKYAVLGRLYNNAFWFNPALF